MARTTRYPIYSVIHYQPLFSRSTDSSLRSSWLHKQPNTPGVLQSDLVKEMEKIIKYYPKKLSSLKQITLAYNCDTSNTQTKRLYRKIVSKYRKDFFRYFFLNIDQKITCPSSSLFLRSFCYIKALYVYSESKFIQSYKHFPRILKKNKLLSHLQMNTSDGVSLLWFRYLVNLRRLQIHSIPEEEWSNWRRSLPKVELLTIFGQIHEENIDQFVEGIRKIYQYNSLIKLNCELDVSDNRVLGRIPFEDLKNYDFRISTDDKRRRNLKLTGLAQADFLGISCVKDESTVPLQDNIQISSLELQRQSKNIFFLGGANQSSLNAVIKSCQNITTLDLVLSGSSEYFDYSLPSLNHLINLKHLSLKIFEYNNSFGKQWKPVIDLAKYNQKLSYLSLCFKSGKITERNSKNIDLLLDALKDSLTTLLFSFRGGWIERGSYEDFAPSFSNLQKLKSLYLDNSYLSESLKPPMLCGLEELNLFLWKMSMKVLEPILKEAPKLTKLVLRGNSFDQNFNFSKAFAGNAELKDLELIVGAFPKRNWNALARALPQFQHLETLKIGSRDNEFSLVDLVDNGGIQEIIKNHPSLKLVALGYKDEKNDYVVRSVAKRNYYYNIENFFCRFKHDLLDNSFR